MMATKMPASPQAILPARTLFLPLPTAAQALIRIARRLYAHEPLGIDLDETVYALMSLCLSLFPWAESRRPSFVMDRGTIFMAKTVGQSPRKGS